MKSFSEFVSKKEREHRRQLKLIGQVLETNGLKVSSHVDEDEPFVFVFNNSEKLSFDGVRIYSIGDSIAYRVQKEEETHPYGKAYLMDIEEMYNDLVSSRKKPAEAAKEIIETINLEMNKFFEKSAKAEEELKDREIQSGDPLDRTLVKSTGTDYSNSVTGKGNYGG